MNAALRSELFKERSTSTAFGLFGAMLGLVVFAVALHGASLPLGNLDSTSDLVTVVFGWGAVFGSLFAALLGAMSITGEIRHGTIRPTLLITPNRTRLIAAKIVSSTLVGAGYGMAAATIAIVTGVATLEARGIDIMLNASDFMLLIGGGAGAAALSAAIGVGIGAILRNQVQTLIGICVWLLLIENLLLGNVTDLGNFGPYLPGAAGKAMSGLDPDSLLDPLPALVVLVVYAGVAAVVGGLAIDRRDFD